MEARASLILEVIRGTYDAEVASATAATKALTDAQAAVIAQAPAMVKAQSSRGKATSDATAADKEASKAVKDLERAYISALAPHEKTALKLEEVLELRFDDIELTSKQAVAAAHLSAKLEDQTRRFEANRGSQNKLSRSLAELLDEQTKAQTAAIAMGAALIKEGVSADKLSSAVAHLRQQEGDHREELARLQTQLEQVTAAEKAQGKAQEEASKHYKASADKLDAVKNALEGLGIPGAQTVDSIKKLNDGLVKMHNEGNAAEAAMLRNAIAVGAVGAASFAAVAGAAALTAAVIANSAAADEWNEELDALGLKLDDVGTERVNRAAAAIDAIGAVSKAAGVAIADSFSPAVEEGATRAVALGLAAIDTWKNFSAGKDTLTTIADLVSVGLVGAFNALLSPIKSAALGLALLSDTVGITDDAAVNLTRRFDEWTDALEESTSTGLQAMVRDGLEPLIAASDDYMVVAAGIVSRQSAVNKEMREGKGAAEELAVAIEMADVAYGKEILQLTKLQKMGAVKTIKEITDATEDGAAAALAWGQAAAYGSQMFQIAARVAGDAIMTFGRDAEKAALAAFVAQQAAALAQVGVDTAAAIVKGIAIFGPPPSPAGIAAIATAGAIGLTAAASIAGQTVGAFRQTSVSAGGGGAGGGATRDPSSADRSPGSAAAVQESRGDDGSEAAGSSGSGGRKGQEDNVPVTDAFFPASMGRRTFTTTPGDEVTVNRASSLGRSAAGDPGMRRHAEAQVAATRETNGLLRQLLDMMTIQQHMAAVAGPAGRG